MLIPEPIEKALNFPWHLTKGVANLAAFPVRLLLNDNYLPETEVVNGEATVYDVISPMLDNATIIYYYTELRSDTNERLHAYRGKLDRTEGELDEIRNAIQFKKNMLEKLEAADESSPFGTTALTNYKTSLLQLDELKIRRFPHLTNGDIEVLEAYFEILSQPKNFVQIKSDIELYGNYVNPAFDFFLGGKDHNVKRFNDIVDSSPKAYIHKIDDDFVKSSTKFVNGLGSELVYTICVSKESKRVTVTFRGSINANDWITNVRLAMTDLKLPGYTSEENAKGSDTRKSYGRVHRGFYNYLFGKTKMGNNGSYKSKAEEIMGILRSLLDGECRGYSIFVTGHSLGGAISTLFAFRAAALGELPMVTNVSLASPYVGDQSFRDSFYELEQNNQIRHLRVSNDEDIVPLIPPVAPGIPALSLGPVPAMENYKHTGMNIHLFHKNQIFMPKVRVLYPKRGSWPNEARNAVLKSLPTGLSVGVISKHLCPEYTSRLDDAKEDLRKVTVEGLYSNNHLTGWAYKSI